MTIDNSMKRTECICVCNKRIKRKINYFRILDDFTTPKIQ